MTAPGLRVDRPAVGRALGAVGRLGVADDVAVDDDLDRVALVLVELRRVGDVEHLAVDPDADEALAAGAVEDPVALGLAVLDERPEDEQARPLGQRQDLVDDLLDRLALDRVAVRAVRDADPREQQPEVVVDLGDGADRRARVARRALLVDRDGRREAVDLVDVRLLHLAEELAGVGAQALDVAALALGVDRVEGEARLAAAGQAGDDDEAVARERDVDVLEVVFARAAHDESDPGARLKCTGCEANRTGVPCSRSKATATRDGRSRSPSRTGSACRPRRDRHRRHRRRRRSPSRTWPGPCRRRSGPR